MFGSGRVKSCFIHCFIVHVVVSSCVYRTGVDPFLRHLLLSSFSCHVYFLAYSSPIFLPLTSFSFLLLLLLQENFLWPHPVFAFWILDSSMAVCESAARHWRPWRFPGVSLVFGSSLPVPDLFCTVISYCYTARPRKPPVVWNAIVAARLKQKNRVAFDWRLCMFFSRHSSNLLSEFRPKWPHVESNMNSGLCEVSYQNSSFHNGFWIVGWSYSGFSKYHFLGFGAWVLIKNRARHARI